MLEPSGTVPVPCARGDRQGWRKCRKRRSNFLPTARDGGSAENAGAVFGPYILDMRRFGLPWPLTAYSPSLDMRRFGLPWPLAAYSPSLDMRRFGLPWPLAAYSPSLDIKTAPEGAVLSYSSPGHGRLTAIWHQSATMFSAWGPFWPWVTVNSTF